jgi:hypothetical protein
MPAFFIPRRSTGTLPLRRGPKLLHRTDKSRLQSALDF